MGDVPGDERRQVEPDEAATPEHVFDVVAEDPQEVEVAEDVHPPGVEEPGGDDGPEVLAGEDLLGHAQELVDVGEEPALGEQLDGEEGAERGHQTVDEDRGALDRVPDLDREAAEELKDVRQDARRRPEPLRVHLGPGVVDHGGQLGALLAVEPDPATGAALVDDQLVPLEGQAVGLEGHGAGGAAEVGGVGVVGDEAAAPALGVADRALGRLQEGAAAAVAVIDLGPVVQESSQREGAARTGGAVHRAMLSRRRVAPRGPAAPGSRGAAHRGSARSSRS